MNDTDPPDPRLWSTVLRRALEDNESLALDNEADRERLIDVLAPLMRAAEQHGYVNGAMDVSDAAEAIANGGYAEGFIDGAEGAS